MCLQSSRKAQTNSNKMKINIELNIIDTEKPEAFLNFWNWYNGEDVVCLLQDGKLLLYEYDEDGNETIKEITLQEFLGMVIERAQRWPDDDIEST